MENGRIGQNAYEVKTFTYEILNEKAVRITIDN